MKILITEEQLKTIISNTTETLNEDKKGGGRKLKYGELSNLSDNELNDIIKKHIEKYRTVRNNKSLRDEIIRRDINLGQFMANTKSKKYRTMSDDELLIIARRFDDIYNLQRENGVLYYELKKRGLSKQIFTPFKKHVNTEIPNNMFLKKQKDKDELDDDRRYEKSVMFTPITESTETLNEDKHSSKEVKKLIDWSMKHMGCYYTQSTDGIKLCPPDYVNGQCRPTHLSDKALYPMMRDIAKWFGCTKHDVERAFRGNRPI